MLLPINNPKILRDQITLALAGEIGQYSRPSLPPAPAIWVWASRDPVPSGYKVITALRDQPLINALEVIIRRSANYEDTAGNYSSRAIEQSWQVSLIFHDHRQSEEQAILSMMANFKCPAPASLGATELSPEQFVFQIKNSISLIRH